MTTDCSTNLFGFTEVEGREVVAGFDGGAITSDAGALLLGAADGAIGLIDRFAACFHDERVPSWSNTRWQRSSGSAYSVSGWGTRTSTTTTICGTIR